MKSFLSFILPITAIFIAQISHANNWINEGERLTYKVKWSFIDVGEAELLFKPGHETYSVIGRAWTGGSVSSMYNLQDRIKINGNLTAQNSFLTTNYTAVLNENDYRAHKFITYDRQSLKSHYTNVHAGLKPIVFDIKKQSRDMISALYYLRNSAENVKVGSIYKTPIFEMDKTYDLEVKVLKKEKMNTVLGRVEVFKIQPILYAQKNKKSKKKDKLIVWVTADGKYIPVKIKIDLRIGSFSATLTKLGRVEDTSRAPLSLPEKGPITVAKKKKKQYSAPVPE